MRKLNVKLKYFKDRHGNAFYAKKKADPLLCRSKLFDLFSLPKKGVPITVVIADKEMPNSYKARLIGGTLVVHYEDDWRRIFSYLKAREFLRDANLDGREFWVTLYWEE